MFEDLLDALEPNLKRGLIQFKELLDAHDGELTYTVLKEGIKLFRELIEFELQAQARLGHIVTRDDR